MLVVSLAGASEIDDPEFGSFSVGPDLVSFEVPEALGAKLLAHTALWADPERVLWAGQGDLPCTNNAASLLFGPSPAGPGGAVGRWRVLGGVGR